MFRRQRQQEPFRSGLFDQTTFYAPFLKDLSNCTQSLVIESPFITVRRVNVLLPELSILRKRGVRIVINTREPVEHEGDYQAQAEEAVIRLQSIGVEILYTVRHHRKIAIIDRQVIWEGSLNILSYNDSCEIMRRIPSSTEAEILINFINLRQYLQNSAS